MIMNEVRSSAEVDVSRSWLSVVQVLLDVSIALLVAIIEFHGGIHRGYRTISSDFVFVKRYTQTHLKELKIPHLNLKKTQTVGVLYWLHCLKGIAKR